MSKRLQVLVTAAEMEEIKRLARIQGLPVGEWVRRAMRAARAQQPVKDAETKLAVVRKAMTHAYPTGDIDQILEETERGYHG